MTWMFWRRKRIQEAAKALESSKRAQDEVNDVSRKLKKRGEENRFAPMIYEAFQQGGKP